jgi:FixJ family two-component response regulator
MGVVARFAEGHQSLVAPQNNLSSTSPGTLVVVIDDDASTRRSLVRSIETAGYEVQAFSSAADFLAGILPEVAFCVVCDLVMPGLSGLQLQESLRSRLPSLSIVFVTGHGNIPSSVSAIKAGAVDFLEKPIRRNSLLEAIRSAVERTTRMRAAAAEIAEFKKRYERLTRREREVFVLVSAGLLNKQVACQLGAAEKTVKQHRGSIMRKIGAESLADLVVMAERLGVRATNAHFAQAKGKLSA